MFYVFWTGSVFYWDFTRMDEYKVVHNCEKEGKEHMVFNFFFYK